MIKRLITEKSLELGFSQCGFAKYTPLEEYRDFYNKFVSEKRYGTLQYLERYAGERMDPAKVMPGVKTIIALALNYFPEREIPRDYNFIIAKYAYGLDYHQVMRDKMGSLLSFMKSFSENCHARAFVDSGPVLEKAWARRCGIGWQGKNTLVINKTAGSFFFIGILMTNLEMEPDAPGTDRCGECEQCIKACPTGALDIPYQLDIPGCISYQTIENKGETMVITGNNITDSVYGCDICQDVCPYNHFAQPHQTPEFHPSEELLGYRKKDWLSLKETDFTRLFAGTPLMRLGYTRFIRNIDALTNHGL